MDLHHGVARFQTHVLPRLAEHYAGLANGQKPHTLFVTCSDSRIDPSLITQSLPGELFIVRNAGNLVPPPDADYATSSAVEYAVDVLRVQQIVVCGHSGCGAMAARLAPASVEGLPYVKRWLEVSGVRVHGDDLAAQVDGNARAQLDSLRAHPSVAQALAEGRLTLKAWSYDIPSGAVTTLAEVTS